MNSAYYSHGLALIFLLMISKKFFEFANQTSFPANLRKILAKNPANLKGDCYKCKQIVGLLLGAMLVCTFIWYRTRFMNYILLGVAEFMLVGVLAAGAFILALVTEARDGVGRFIIGD